jgi:glycosyltransferase involved in cell wall biosynthesis
MNDQKVTVIIPTCNRPELLLRSLRSVLAQTYTNIEVIVVDDGEKVSAQSAVLEVNDDRVIYIQNDPKRQGGGASRNIGITNATSQWIAFQDDDDEWLPNKLELQMEAMHSASPQVGFATLQ